MVSIYFSASGMSVVAVISCHVLTSFSWVLIAFKREFSFDDVLRLWEVLWTDYYSNNFVLFIALAVLESHRDMILRYLVEVCDLFFCGRHCADDFVHSLMRY